jgi:glycosyltransferase involved in cell wall biosynthesis
MTPTFNERANIDEFVRRTRAAVPDAHIFVVDDASPDGTGERVIELAASDPLLSLMFRDGVRGYAAASRDGLSRISALGFDAIVTIDCDLSHDPRDIPMLLEALSREADVAIGSRYVPSGGVRNWPLSRRLLSRWGNWYTGIMLGLGLRDCTSGFRAYRSQVVRSGVIAATTSDGYSFLTEVLYRLRGGFVGADGVPAAPAPWHITEVPIIYTERVAGESKMNKTIISESMRRVTLWGLRRLMSQAQGRHR